MSTKNAIQNLFVIVTSHITYCLQNQFQDRVYIESIYHGFRLMEFHYLSKQTVDLYPCNLCISNPLIF